MKITKIRTTPVLVSHPKQVGHYRKRVFCFYCGESMINNNKESNIRGTLMS